jgi:uncharacterized protein (DUF2267 family)
MKLTGLGVFDAAIERTNMWLKDLMQELNLSDHRKAYMAFRCVLHGVRDHLPVTDAVRFGDQLPTLIRGVYFDHWDPTGKPFPLRTRADFLAALSTCLTNISDAEVAARAVFRLLEKKAADGEIENLQRLLPLALQDLWPETLRAA